MRIGATGRGRAGVVAGWEAAGGRADESMLLDLVRADGIAARADLALLHFRCLLQVPPAPPHPPQRPVLCRST